MKTEDILYIAAVFVVGYGYAVYVGFRYGRRWERLIRRQSEQSLYEFRREQERTIASLN